MPPKKCFNKLSATTCHPELDSRSFLNEILKQVQHDVKTMSFRRSKTTEKSADNEEISHFVRDDIKELKIPSPIFLKV